MTNSNEVVGEKKTHIENKSPVHAQRKIPKDSEAKLRLLFTLSFLVLLAFSHIILDAGPILPSNECIRDYTFAASE